APPAPTKLELANPIKRELPAGGSHSYSLTLDAGQHAHIVVEQHGVDIVVQILDPQQKTLAFFDSEIRPTGVEHAYFVADASASYEVRVKTRYPMLPGGNYEIHLEELRIANETDRATYDAYRLASEANFLHDAGKYEDAIARWQQALDSGEKTL